MMDIMVVDDESLIRSVLRSIIEQEGSEFRVVAEAYSGREALRLARRRPLDLVLTDLRMPEMTGLELIQALKPLHPDVRFVVLSSYDEFNLVRDAFKLGITEYLLKSEMTPEGILALLHRIDAESREDRKQRNVADYLRRNQRLVRENVLSSAVLHPERTAGATGEEIGALGLRLAIDGVTTVLTVTVDEIRREGEESARSHQLRGELYGILEKILEDDREGEVFYRSVGEYVVTWCVGPPETDTSLSERAARVFHLARERALSALGLEVAGGQSGVGRGLESLPELRRQSESALAWRFIHGKGSYFPFGGVAQRVPSTHEEITDGWLDRREQELKGLLRSHESAGDGRSVDGLCLERRRVVPGDVPGVRRLFERYYHVILEFARQFSLDEVLVDRFAEYERCRRAGTLDDFNTWLRRTLEDLRRGMAGSLHLLGKAKLLIGQRYTEPLSLGTVAAEMGVSANHLSRVFARDGVSFSEYLTRARVDAAIVLMKETNLKVYQIAERLSFSSPENFCRTFKRVTGMSPSQYLKPG